MACLLDAAQTKANVFVVRCNANAICAAELNGRTSKGPFKKDSLSYDSRSPQIRKGRIALIARNVSARASVCGSEKDGLTKIIAQKIHFAADLFHAPPPLRRFNFRVSSREYL
jgi:hypothetical protein